jgi:hypothetical protein
VNKEANMEVEKKTGDEKIDFNEKMDINVENNNDTQEKSGTTWMRRAQDKREWKLFGLQNWILKPQIHPGEKKI